MDKIQELRIEFDAALHDESKPWEPVLSQLEVKTGIERINLVYGGLLIFAVYITFGYGAQLITNLIGLMYPAYVSIRAIETSSKKDDTKWLIYWVTFACITTFEYFSNFLVSWIPLYWLIKCGFLVWCMLPIQKNGSKVLYDGLIRPYFLKYSGFKDDDKSN